MCVVFCVVLVVFRVRRCFGFRHFCLVSLLYVGTVVGSYALCVGNGMLGHVLYALRYRTIVKKCLVEIMVDKISNK